MRRGKLSDEQNVVQPDEDFVGEMKSDYFDSFKEFERNKTQSQELNRRNTEICKFLDKKYGYPKGTSRAYFMKKLKQRSNKDLSEDVYELETTLEE